jgi:hypothetical protein
VKEQKLREKVTPADKKTLTCLSKRIDGSIDTTYIVNSAQGTTRRKIMCEEEENG